jgi:hypothetical protein
MRLGSAATEQGTKGIEMAGGNDMKAHETTYSSVMALLKWGAILSFLTGMIVILIIAA